MVYFSAIGTTKSIAEKLVVVTKAALIKDLVQSVNGTIIECNTTYGGGRADTESHRKAAADYGFTAIAPVDIMDADGHTAISVKGGKHMKEDFVSKNYMNYNFTVVLSHFKVYIIKYRLRLIDAAYYYMIEKRDCRNVQSSLFNIAIVQPSTPRTAAPHATDITIGMGSVMPFDIIRF